MFPVPERLVIQELLDDADGRVGRRELAGSLADIRVVNRRLGGIKASVGHLAEMLSGIGDGPLTILDVASGSADIPLAMVDWARARGISVRVVALDVSRAITSHAASHTQGYQEITCMVADGLELPFRPGSFDIVHCSMALHHFSETDAVRLISGMARVARRGLILCDLRRSWVAYALIFTLSRLLSGNRLTVHDGPVSVLRSYTPDELEGLARGAGLSGFRVQLHPYWRMALVGEFR